MNSEIPDVLGFSAMTSVLIECKMSRADFFKDQNKKHRQGKGMGMYRFYCCPIGLIKKEELPEKWGLLYVSETMKVICIVNPIKNRGFKDNKYDTQFDRDLEAEQRLMYSALRRLHLRDRIKEIYQPLQ